MIFPGQNISFLIAHEPSLGSCVATRILVRRFNIYWLQTDRQAKYIYIDIDKHYCSFLQELYSLK